MDRNGTRVDFGGITVIRFTNGVSTVTAGSNGVLYLYKAQQANVSVTDARSRSDRAGPAISV